MAEEQAFPGGYSLAQIRGILTEEIESLRAGTSSASKVNAVSNATGKILVSVRLQMEYYRLRGAMPFIGMLESPDGPQG